MDVLNKIKTVMFDPDKFFDGVKKESLETPIKYLLLILIVPAAFITVLSSFIIGMIGLVLGGIIGAIPMGGAFGTLTSLFPLLGPMLGFFVGGAFYVASIVGSFVSAAIIHAIVYVMGKRGFANTFKAMVYGGTPRILFLWIPGVNVIFGLWSWFLTIKGISKLHGMTMGRAFFVTLVPAIVALMIAGVAIGLAPFM